MGRLFGRLGELFKAGDEVPAETPEGAAAMDAALQAAIKKRATMHAGKGVTDDAANQPRVTILPDKDRAVFGRRAD